MHLSEHPREHRTTDGIDAAAPGFRFQRTLGCLVDFITHYDLCCAQTAQIVFGFRTAGHGGNFVPEVGQDGRCHRAHAPCCACHKNRAILDAMLFQRHDGQHCGEASGADGHRLTGGEAFGQGHQHVAGHPGLLGIAAPAVFTDAPTGEHHLVAGLVALVGRVFHRARKVDARHMWIGPHQSAAGADAQAVLVVHGRVLNGNGHIALGQLILVDFGDRGRGFAFFVFLDEQCFKHGFS